MRKPSTNVFYSLVLALGILSVCLFSQQLTALSAKARIDAVLEPLPGLINADSTGEAAQRHLAKNELTNSTILSYAFGVESPLYDPTPERQQRFTEIEGLLNAHESTMLHLLRASSSSNKVPDQLHRLLRMTKPTPEVRSALLEVIHSETATRAAVIDSYDTLFNLKLDDALIRQELVQLFSHRDELHTRAELSRALLGSAITRWALEEAEPYISEFLNIAYKPENFPKRGGKNSLVGQYVTAASGLKAYGVKGAKYAALLKARLAELESDQEADVQSTAALLREVISIVEGHASPKPFVNAKFQLLGISQNVYPEWQAIYGGNAHTTPPTTKQSPLGVEQQPKRKVPAFTAPATSTAEPNSPKLWIVIVVGAVVGFYLLWRRIKRRS